MQWHSTFSIMLALTCCSNSTMNAAQNCHAFRFRYKFLWCSFLGDFSYDFCLQKLENTFRSKQRICRCWELVLLHLHPVRSLVTDSEVRHCFTFMLKSDLVWHLHLLARAEQRPCRAVSLTRSINFHISDEINPMYQCLVAREMRLVFFVSM